MKDYKVLYFHKPNWEGMDLFPDVSVPLLWPTYVFSVLVAEYPQRKLNFFEICILRLLGLSSCNVDILCERTCLREGFVRLILRRLRDQGLVKEFHLTEQGQDMLNETMAEEPVIRNVFVFCDCLSKKFYPMIASKLEIRHGNGGDDNISFSVTKGSRRISASPACQPSRCKPPTQTDVMEIIHEFNALCATQTADSPSIYQESPENIEVSREKPDLVWLYSEARLGRNNHRIYVSDPFWSSDSVILGENMDFPELDRVTAELKRRGVTIHGEPHFDGDDKIDRFESLQSRLRPLSGNPDQAELQTNLSESDRMERLSDFYYALEQSFKKMLEAYDYTNLVNSLRGFDENTIRDLLIRLAADLGVKSRHGRNNDNAPAPPPPDTRADKSDAAGGDTGPNVEPPAPKPWLKQNLSLERFFSFSGSRLQECLTGEANLRFWLGLALLVDKKRPLPARQKLFRTEVFQFIDYLSDFRNSEYHGGMAEQLPTRNEMESCLVIARGIVDFLLPDSNISALADSETSDLDEQSLNERYYKAESDLIHQLGYAQMRQLPKDLKEKLIRIRFHIIGRNREYIFSNILMIDSLLFKIAAAERLPEIPGNDVLQRARSHFPQLPEIFWEVNPRKLTGVIAGIPQSLRASLVCLMAFCEKHRAFFTPERLLYLEQVLRLRTHDWQGNVLKKDFTEIEKLGEQTISFTIAIIKEYRYEEK